MSTPSPCSVLNSQAPLAGTAPTSDSWLILFHQGAWGERPVETLVSPKVRTWAQNLGAQVLIARSPKDVHAHPVSTFWFANSNGRLLKGTLNSEGLPDLQRTNESKPLLLICTNGKRDQCCATFGRSLITRCKEFISPESFGQILECSHLGGHRFAPTAIWLPRNLVLGRLDQGAIVNLLEKGEVDSQFLRGSTRLSPAQQVVEVFLWPQKLKFQSCEQVGSDFRIKVLRNGAMLSFNVTATPVNTVASCGAEPKATVEYRIKEDY